MRIRYSLSFMLSATAALASSLMAKAGLRRNTPRRQLPPPGCAYESDQWKVPNVAPSRGWWSERQSEDDAQWHLKRAKGRRIRRAERANPSGYARRNDPRLA